MKIISISIRLRKIKINLTFWIDNYFSFVNLANFLCYIRLLKIKEKLLKDLDDR